MDFGMTETKIELRKLTASEGMVLTNGEAFSSVGGYIILGCSSILAAVVIGGSEFSPSIIRIFR